MAISIFKLDIYSKVLYFIVPVLLYIFCALITKIINDVTDENQNTYKILQLFLNTLSETFKIPLL